MTPEFKRLLLVETAKHLDSADEIVLCIFDFTIVETVEWGLIPTTPEEHVAAKLMGIWDSLLEHCGMNTDLTCVWEYARDHGFDRIFIAGDGYFQIDPPEGVDVTYVIFDGGWDEVPKGVKVYTIKNPIDSQKSIR